MRGPDQLEYAKGVDKPVRSTTWTDASHATKDGFAGDACIALNAGQEPMNHNKVSVVHQLLFTMVSRNARAYGKGVTIYPAHLRNITVIQCLYEIQSATEQLDAPAHEGELKYKFVMYLSNRVVYG